MTSIEALYFSTVTPFSHVQHARALCLCSYSFLYFFSSHKSAFMFEGPFGKNDIFQICSVDKDLHPDCAVIRPQPMRFHVLFLLLSSLSFERNSVNTRFCSCLFLAQLSLGVVLTLEEGLLVSLLDFYTDFLCQMAARAFSLVSQLIDCAVESASSSVVCI